MIHVPNHVPLHPVDVDCGCTVGLNFQFQECQKKGLRVVLGKDSTEPSVAFCSHPNCEGDRSFNVVEEGRIRFSQRFFSRTLCSSAQVSDAVEVALFLGWFVAPAVAVFSFFPLRETLRLLPVMLLIEVQQWVMLMAKLARLRAQANKFSIK